MKKILYLLICVFPFLFSCRKEVKIREIIVNDSLFKTIVVDPNDIDPKEWAKISKIATGVEYIPLQTRDSVLIGKIEKLIVWNNKYYIWDQLTETIFCFDAKGNFIHKINKQGEGPDEYPRISDFTMDMKSGDIHIYADRARALYSFTEKGEFIKKTPHPFILTSFTVQGNFTYYYLGRSPNVDFYGEAYPNQYRYVVVNNNEVKHQQLKYTFDEKYLQIPISDKNFSFYKDTLLLVESLRPDIYTIDSIGRLIPRYRIEFLTNTYSPSFDGELDVKRMKNEQKEGNLTTLFGGFFETDNYLFFSYARGLIGEICVSKKDGLIHNMGYFLEDDFNHNSLSNITIFADEEYAYKTAGPDLLVKNRTYGRFSSYLNEVTGRMQEFDNPVIVKIKLK